MIDRPLLPLGERAGLGAWQMGDDHQAFVDGTGGFAARVNGLYHQRLPATPVIKLASQRPPLHPAM